MKRLLFILLLVACIVVILLVRQRRFGEEAIGVTLKFSFWGGETEKAAIEEVCREFEKQHPLIHVRTEPLPWGEYWLKMKTRTAGGSDRPSDEPPDIIRMTSLFGAEWYSRGLLLDLTPFIRRDGVELDAFYRASVDAATWEGRLHSMPTDAAVRVLMYNKDLFDRAGVPYLDARKPVTWDELRDIAKRLTVVKDGQVAQYGLTLGYMEYQAFVAQAGGRVVDDVVKAKRMMVDSPEGVRALDFYSGLIVRDKVSPATRQQQNLGFGAPDWALQSGTVAIQHGGTWSIPGLAETKIEGAPLRFGLAPVAMDRKRSQVAFTNSCGVYVKSRHREEAWLFVKFFASAEGQRLVASRGIGIPVLREVARSDAFLKEPHGVANMDVFLDELECAETNVCAPTEEFRNQMEKIVYDQLCLGTIDAKEAARRMEQDGNRILAMERVEATTLTGVVIPAILAGCVAVSSLWLLLRRRRRGRGEARPPTKHENIAGYLFISPWLVGLVLFALGPVVLALATSFTDWNIFHEPRYVGAGNYAKILGEDREFRQSLQVTAIYALTSIPIQLAGGLLCAMLLNLRGLRFEGLVRTVLYLPYLLTGVAISLIWRWMYAENGIVNHMLAWVGIAGPNWLMKEGWALPAMILMNFTWLGGNMIIFLAALQGVPQSLYDAAQVDGAGPARRFWHVTLPMISPAVLFNLIMGTIWSFQVFAVPRIMTDGGPNDATLFYVLNLYRRAFQYNEMGYACALAFVLFVVIFIVSWLELRGSRKWVHYEGSR